MKRFEMLSFTAAAMAIATRGASAQADTIRLGSPLGEEGMPIYVAQRKGFFKAAGLNIDFQVFANGGAVSQALLSGALDLGAADSGGLSLAHVRGIPIYLIACGGTYNRAAPNAHFAVNKTLGISSAKDLTGKTVAISTLRSVMEGAVRAWIDKNGGDSKAVNYFEMGFPQMQAALDAKRVDAAAIIEPFFEAARPYVGDIGFPFSAVNDGKPFMTTGVAANAAWFEKNAATAKSFAVAFHQAARWANNPRNHDETAAILSEIAKLDIAAVKSYPRVVFAESNDPGLIQPVINNLARYDILPKPFAAAEVFGPGVV